MRRWPLDSAPFPWRLALSPVLVDGPRVRVRAVRQENLASPSVVFPPPRGGVASCHRAPIASRRRRGRGARSECLGDRPVRDRRRCGPVRDRPNRRTTRRPRVPASTRRWRERLCRSRTESNDRRRRHSRRRESSATRSRSPRVVADHPARWLPRYRRMRPRFDRPPSVSSEAPHDADVTASPPGTPIRRRGSAP